MLRLKIPIRAGAIICGLIIAVAAIRVLASQAGEARISGRVVDGVHSSVVAGAMVTLSSPAIGVRRFVTAANGAFEFPHLPAGSYDLHASRKGFADGAFGRAWLGGENSAIELRENETVAHVAVSLWRLAAVSGSISDSADDPFVGVKVYAVRRSTRGLEIVREATTDDRGRYRLDSMAPGEYTLVVPATVSFAPRALTDISPISARNATPVRGGDLAKGMNNLPVGPPSVGEVSQIFTTTYLGGASNSEDAESIVLQPGEERLADFHLRPTGGVSLSGVLTDGSGPVPLTGIELQRTSLRGGVPDSPFDSFKTVSDNDGKFSFPVVPPGAYQLRVLAIAIPARFTAEMVGLLRKEFAAGFMLKSPAYSGGGAPPRSERISGVVEPISVGHTAIPSIVLSLAPTARLGGQAHFKGSRALPSAGQMRAMAISVVATDGSKTSDLRPGTVLDTGAFTTHGALPGSYVLVLLGGPPNGWYLESAMLNGKDLLDYPIDLMSSDVMGIALNFADTLGSLAGRVTKNDGAPDLDAVVVAFPDDDKMWSSGSDRRFRVARPTNHGDYVIPELPPGGYFVAAIDISQWRDWRRVDVLNRLRAVATSVRIDRSEVRRHLARR